MTSYLAVAVGLALGIFGLGGGLGFLLHKRQPAGYRWLRKLLRNRPTANPVTPEREWSIGMYEGSSQWELKSSPRIVNPVLTRHDVTDFDAELLADPFLIVRDGVHHLFFEALVRGQNRGVICHATSSDGVEWLYGGMVLEEPFHLSYPHVFEWAGEVHMVPESHGDGSVRLYRAARFPDRWEFVDTLLSGHDYVDATLFRHDGRWWMFASTTRNDLLNLYHSEHLEGGWTPHPMNPVVKFDMHTARPAGRVIEHEGKLFRFGQDDDPDYGIQVFGFEIVEISTTRYHERRASERPVVAGSGTGWNAAGMHHVDLHRRDGGWLAVVDGRSA